MVTALTAWGLVVCAPLGWTAAGDPGCTLTSSPGMVSRQIDGRPYFVNVPDGLPGPSAPLLLALHAPA